MVNVSGPGKLKLAETSGVKGAKRRVDVSGTEVLTVKPKGNAKKRLNKTGHATVAARVTYTPDDGASNTKSKKIKLLKR